METFTIGPEAGKVYQSKKGYPCKADRGIDSVSAQVHHVHIRYCPFLMNSARNVFEIAFFSKTISLLLKC